MNPLSYKELQRSSVEIQRKVYGWAFEFGPILVRPDIHDITRRKIINYYFNRRYVLTSARRYVIVNIFSRCIIIGFWRGRIRVQERFRANN